MLITILKCVAPAIAQRWASSFIFATSIIVVAAGTLHLTVIREEVKVVAMLLLRLLERRHRLLLRHDGVEVRLCLLHGQADMDRRKQGLRFIVGGFLHRWVVIAHLQRA